MLSFVFMSSFRRDQFPDLRADCILAHPPFNISDWWHASLTGDARFAGLDTRVAFLAHEATNMLRT